MRTALIGLAALALTGCSATPDEIKAEGNVATRTSTQVPSWAARCLIRNAEARGGGLFGMESPIEGDGEEVVIRSWSTAMAPLAVARVMPAGNGARITLRTRKDMPREFADALLKGC
ncbi:MAG TPA: hypothetical protein VMN03_16165 [Burkholderiales bacterium]|jgi:hypothetical protein|nr:hypothetical protein [Burkholderiales bacterium]